MKRFYILLAVTVIILAYSCKKNEETEKNLLATDAPETIIFNADGTGDINVINISTNSPEWAYTMSPEDGAGWLTVNKKETSLELSATVVDSPIAREDVLLTITAGNATPVNITVKQLPADEKFSVLPALSSIAFEADGTYKTDDGNTDDIQFSVITNLPDGWEVSTYPENSWISIANVSEEGFTVKASANTTGEERSEVSIKVIAGDMEKVMTASQKRAGIINAEGLSDEKVILTFTDGSIIDASSSEGKIVYSREDEKKLIYSIQPESVTDPVFIGRYSDEKVSLKFKDNKLTFRDAVDGKVPLGSYSEIQLLRNDEVARTWDFIQEADLDLLGSEDITKNGLERRNWNTLGSDQDHMFTGSYDGNGFKIHNIYSDWPQNDKNSQYISFIGFMSSANLKNIDIQSGFISGMGNVGGICGAAEGGLISNCHNAAKIVGLRNTGGICGIGTPGYVDEFKDEELVIEGCTNNGEIIYSMDLEINDLISKIGGIIGYSTNGVTVRDCNNIANITGKESTGGISGLTQFNIENCTNSGNVSGTNDTGGICGRLESTNGFEGETGKNSVALNCKNSGNVNGTMNVGGIAGGVSTADIISSINYGEVSSSGDRAGGISGTVSFFGRTSNIYNSYSTGNVSGNDKVGGLIGFFLSGQMNGCYATGQTSGNGVSVGAVAGENNSKATIGECFWLSYDDKNAIGKDNNGETDAYAFSAENWPSTSMNFWKTGNGDNGINWKSLGSWRNGGTPEGSNSEFPTLFWE